MATSSYSLFGVLGFYTETPLHCGAEGAAGYVDLPVQRERHTGYPVIQGSSVKGVLRDECRRRDSDNTALLDDDELKDVFGSAEDEELATRPGKVSFGDGLLVAFPVRSSGAPFHWVTCPFVLQRALRLLGLDWTHGSPEAGVAWARSNGDILLEELVLRREAKCDLFDRETGTLSALLSLLPPEDAGFTYLRKLLLDRLLVVTDDEFKTLTETATDEVTRIKLNYLGTTENLDQENHKGVSAWDLQGNLFVEELVPPETLFVCALRAQTPHARLREALEARTVVRLGGDETIGRGVTHLTYFAEEG